MQDTSGAEVMTKERKRLADEKEKKVHVYARVRGAIAEDGPSALAGMGLAVSRVGRSVDLEGRGKFGPFSDVLGPDATQSDTFDALAPVVDAAIAGRSHGTVLAYGQTGSGKTYTIGVHADGAHDEGVLPRALRRVFAAAAAGGLTVWLSCMQLYQEKLEDLLNVGGGSALRLREDGADPWGPVVIDGLVRHPVASLEQALQLVAFADANRAVCATQMNWSSSRSHAVFSLFMEREKAVAVADAAPGEVTQLLLEASKGPRRTKLHIVDLAGSERVKKTGAVGVAADEAKATNMSLLALGRVVAALASDGGGAAHAPFRDSKLTRLLQVTTTRRRRHRHHRHL